MQTLPFGSQFEEDVFGFSGPRNEAPPYLDYQSAMKEVLVRPPVALGLDGEEIVYNPSSPDWGITGQLWQGVNRHLPRRSVGKKSGHLLLHLSVGTALDYYHGVDCFFWWMMVTVTIDASFILKKRDGDRRFKADMLLTPMDMRQESWDEFTRKVARTLRKKRHVVRKEGQQGRFIQRRKQEELSW